MASRCPPWCRVVYPEADPGAVLAALAPILGAGGGSTRAHREPIGVSAGARAAGWCGSIPTRWVDAFDRACQSFEIARSALARPTEPAPTR